MTAVASPLRRDPRPARPARPGKAGSPGRDGTRLQVVGARRASEAAGRARRRRLVAASLALVVAASLLALVASHAALAQGQFRLEKLQRQAAEEQAHYERLRLQVAQLEAPSRVVAAAQQRLGMVPPPGVTYLSPTGASTGQPGRAMAQKDDQRESATDDWSNVKRQLARR